MRIRIFLSPCAEDMGSDWWKGGMWRHRN